MSWFRLNRQGGAWLAVVAMACQILLSFGHIHASQFIAAPAAWSLTADDGSSGMPSPLPQKSPSGFPDFCAICVHLGMASALLVPAAPIIVTPNSFVENLSWLTAAEVATSFDRFTFNARGPPTPEISA